jgi:general transcription factor 3C polypeptide 5 (transcription factor C subunit 1)
MEPEFEQAPTYSIPNRRFLCVEYPGAVKNIDRVLETLGGEKSIAQVTRKT